MGRAGRTTAITVACVVALAVVHGAPASASEVALVPDPGLTWAEQAPVDTPVPAAWSAMTFDAGRGRLVMFGGYGYDDWTRKTWTWDGSSWEQIDTAISPRGRRYHAFAYDPVHDEIVLFGGSTNVEHMTDTWVLSGDQWTRRHPATSPPDTLFGATMTFDPHLQQLLLIDGDRGTWTWDGTTWTELHPTLTSATRKF